MCCIGRAPAALPSHVSGMLPMSSLYVRAVAGFSHLEEVITDIPSLTSAPDYRPCAAHLPLPSRGEGVGLGHLGSTLWGWRVVTCLVGYLLGVLLIPTGD